MSSFLPETKYFVWFIIITVFLLCILYLYIYILPAINVNANIVNAQLIYIDKLHNNADKLSNVLENRKFVPLELAPYIDLNQNFNTLNNESMLCFNAPIRVSDDINLDFDCSRICQNEASTYFFVGPNDNFVINNDKLTVGGYCTTSTIPQNCNRTTSIAVFSHNQWTCIAESPGMFAGASNMQQVAGRQHILSIYPGDDTKNVVIDGMSGLPVDITRNLMKSSWEDYMPDGITKRFNLVCNARDINQNKMFLNPLNRFECLPNVCTNVPFISTSVKPNFLTGECECGDFQETRVKHIDQADKTSICGGIVNSYDYRYNSFTFRTDCINPRDPISKFDSTRIFCPPSIMDAATDSVMPVTLSGVQILDYNNYNKSPTTRQIADFNNRGIEHKGFFFALKPGFGENDRLAIG